MDNLDNFKKSSGGGINNRLLNNVCSLFGLKTPDKINQEIEEISIDWLDSSRTKFNLNIQLKRGHEWTKDVYDMVLNPDLNISVSSDQILTLHNLSKNDAKIIDFNKSKFIDYIEQKESNNFSELFKEELLKQAILKSDCGIDDENIINSINYQSTNSESKSNTFALTINLNNDYYSIDLEKFIAMGNIEVNQEEFNIDLSKVDVLNFLNIAHKMGDINYQYLNNHLIILK